ncbi:uncharacterized protein LOC134535355 [Bacillus rossius redtenbacheri]|uniref:uncharacterized protein LOC134535355 n=1 Tax=Bacillus rossius redtenbacheri TaxID=93214 RepID=UPI002FDD1DC3
MQSHPEHVAPGSEEGRRIAGHAASWSELERAGASWSPAECSPRQTRACGRAGSDVSRGRKQLALRRRLSEGRHASWLVQVSAAPAPPSLCHGRPAPPSLCHGPPEPAQGCARAAESVSRPARARPRLRPRRRVCVTARPSPPKAAPAPPSLCHGRPAPAQGCARAAESVSRPARARPRLRPRRRVCVTAGPRPAQGCARAAESVSRPARARPRLRPRRRVCVTAGPRPPKAAPAPPSLCHGPPEPAQGCARAAESVSRPARAPPMRASQLSGRTATDSELLPVCSTRYRLDPAFFI